MNFRDTICFNGYEIYNRLGIHGAPEVILDLFIPALCEGSLTDNLIQWVFIKRISKRVRKELEVEEAGMENE